MTAEVQRVPELLPWRVVLLQREVRQLPLHVALLRHDQVPAELMHHTALSATPAATDVDSDPHRLRQRRRTPCPVA